MVTALDSETKLFEAGLLDPDPVCWTYCGDDLEPHIVHAKGAEPMLRALLESEETITTANGPFDFAVMLRAYPGLTKLIFSKYRRGQVDDVQLRQRLIDLAQGRLDGYVDGHGVHHKYYYSLAALYQCYGFGEMAKQDTWRLRYGELMDVPCADWPVEALDYALLDAKGTRQVHGAQTAYSEWLLDAVNQSRAAFALHLMSCEGVHTDPKVCAEVLVETKLEIERCRKLLVEHEIVRPNGTKDTKKAKARMEAVCAELGVPPKRTATEGISLDAEACRDVADPVLLAYAAFTSAKTTLTRVEDLAKGETTPLQTSYVYMVANGRTASRIPSPPLLGIQVQNLPRNSRARECVVAEPGYLLCSVDFSQHELVCAAQIQIWTCGRSKLADALNEGIDVHSLLASQMLGVSYQEVLEHKNGKYKVARALAKNSNFGFWGLMGLARFVAMTNRGATTPEMRINERKARELKAAWLRAWDGQEYFDWCTSQLSENGRGVGTLKQWISGRVRGHIGAAEFANSCFSGLASDAGKSALLPLAEEAYSVESSDFYGSRPKLYIHDEVIAAVPVATASKAAKRQAAIMLECAQRYTPDVKLTAEPCLMRHWFKNAEAVWSPDGELLEWTPTRKAV